MWSCVSWIVVVGGGLCCNGFLMCLVDECMGWRVCVLFRCAHGSFKICFGVIVGSWCSWSVMFVRMN